MTRTRTNKVSPAEETQPQTSTQQHGPVEGVAILEAQESPQEIAQQVLDWEKAKEMEAKEGSTGTLVRGSNPGQPGTAGQPDVQALPDIHPSSAQGMSRPREDHWDSGLGAAKRPRMETYPGMYPSLQGFYPGTQGPANPYAPMWPPQFYQPQYNPLQAPSNPMSWDTTTLLAFREKLNNLPSSSTGAQPTIIDSPTSPRDHNASPPILSPHRPNDQDNQSVRLGLGLEDLMSTQGEAEDSEEQEEGEVGDDEESAYFGQAFQKEESGKDVSQRLADFATKACTLPGEETFLTSLHEKYLKPSNTPEACVPRVNKGVWNGAKPYRREEDLALQKLQAHALYPLYAAIHMAEELDKLRTKYANHSEIRNDLKSLHFAAKENVFLAGQASFQISLRRRNELRPVFQKQFRDLCNKSQPISEDLFGPDLPKACKEIAETAKATNSALVSDRPFRPKGHREGGQSQNGKHNQNQRKQNDKQHSSDQNNSYKPYWQNNSSNNNKKNYTGKNSRKYERHSKSSSKSKSKNY